jgi:hypothetical protein
VSDASLLRSKGMESPAISAPELRVDGPWTPADYRQLLLGLHGRGYRLGTVRAFEAARPDCWRGALFHDVEIDLLSAIVAARIERSVGVAATYYICTTSPFFVGQEGILPKVVGKLIELGHDVGVHLELPELPAVSHGIADRVDAIARACGCNTAMYSIHAPRRHSMSVLASLPRIGPMYRRVMDGSNLFLSDSACRWNYGVPLADVRLATGRPLQLLTHPIWWDGRSDIESRRAGALARGIEAARLNEFLPRFFSSPATP